MTRSSAGSWVCLIELPSYPLGTCMVASLHHTVVCAVCSVKTVPHMWLHPSGNGSSPQHELWLWGHQSVFVEEQHCDRTGFPPHLENLEKQDQTWKNRGFGGKNLEKYCKTWKKILTSHWKSPRASTEKASEKKKSSSSKRSQIFLCLFG